AGREAVLAEMRDVLIPNGLRIGHPGFSGWVTTAPSTIATAADLAQTVVAAQRWWATPGNLLDAVAMRWLVELLGFPGEFGGIFTSGGSTANLLGIGAARQHAGERLGLDVARDGLDGLPEPRVYASTETHHVVGRALGVLGMGRAKLRSIPTTGDGRIDLDLLEAALDEDAAAGRTQVAIVGCAGDVNTGVVDPMDDLARIARERGIWLHVDGAYGGFGLLDDRVRDLYGDISAYDSFAIDPHKWMAAPVGTGATIVRDEGVLARAFAIETGAYDRERDREPTTGDLPSPFVELGHGTPDMGVDFSTPARGVAVWAILSEIGAEGMRARVTRHLDCARRVADRARASDDLELLMEPVLSICCFRYRPAGMTDEEAIDALNERVLEGIRARGRTVTSSTRVDGRLALRPCFINPRSGLEDADALVDEVLAVGRELAAGA
ncbi:MAG: aminotransferase class V-fold PLP-dependent enzyme, partial [Chloroflexi bacterium]|nr:aminotransferase class V-fold PLP-dependent enzyme [Chloroflexota bacterium]